MAHMTFNRIDSVIVEPDLLESLYHGNGYTQQQIADIFGCNHRTIGNRMKKYGISCRSAGYAVTDFTFNDVQKEIFEGCMLGDGGLKWQTHNCFFSNTDIHEEYLVWLQKQLGVEHISKVRPNSVDGYACDYGLITRVIPSIRDEFKQWYPYDTMRGTYQNRNNKIIPKDIELTLIKLLFWYIGDGYYSKRDSTATFGNYLVFEDWLPLSKKISKLLNVDSGVFINKQCKNNNGVQIYRLRLNKLVTSKFFDLVDSLSFDIPDCYHYKFGG